MIIRSERTTKRKLLTNVNTFDNQLIFNELNEKCYFKLYSEIKDIKLDDHGQPVIITSKGEKKALSFRLVKLDEGKS